MNSKMLFIQDNFAKLAEIEQENHQLEAVKQDGYAIQYIKNPSEQVQLEAIKQNGYAIQFIKNPIYYIKNPSEQVQLEAVKQYG
jgi:hypothetical protein